VFFENAVFFPQVVDDVELVAIHPARERNDENPQPDGLNHGTESTRLAMTHPRLSLG
jgi:hypothetical protein